MTDRAALLANVLNHPADDTARLVLADRLEDNSEEAFGRFLRAGALVAQSQASNQPDQPAHLALLQTVTEVARGGAPALWLCALGVGKGRGGDDGCECHPEGGHVTARVGSAGLFTRGMRSELALPLTEWYEVAPAALANWPLARVTATDTPGLVFLVEPPAHRLVPWRLVASLTAQRTRPRRTLLGRFGAALFGPPRAEVADVDSCYWSSERTFASRSDLVSGVF